MANKANLSIQIMALQKKEIKMHNKPKLNIKEQIEWFKNKGVTFKYFTEIQAENFLRESNYFFKLKAFAKNYDKNQDDKYINLDFAYLRELSILDTLLRDIILELCLTCEHLLKVQINTHCSENSNESGYEVVNIFLQDEKNKPKALKSFEKSSSNIYQKDLIDKYYIKQTNGKYKSYFALWNFIEILSFTEFVKFYIFYFGKQDENSQLAFAISKLRNAAAHNFCVLHNLKNNKTLPFKTSKILQTKIREMSIFSPYHKLQQLNNPLLHDCIGLLYLTKQICPQKMRRKLKKKIVEFFRRTLKHSYYFDNNIVIKSNFNFIIKVFLRLF